MISPAELMRRAIAAAREGIAEGESPFGCAIARGDELLAVTHNCVLSSTDITAHAEICALRASCRAADDIHLTGAMVASTCEPCPMCMAALHWARVERVYYGASIADAGQVGFNELYLSAADVVTQGKSNVVLVPGLLTAECQVLFAEWRQSPAARAY